MFLNLLVILALFSVAQAASNCKDSDVKIGECKIKIHDCEDYVDWKWQYIATATEKESGKEKKSDWHSSADSAARHAIEALSKKLEDYSYDKWDCNFDKQDISQQTCHLRILAGWYFKDANAVEDEKPSFMARAYSSDDHSKYADYKDDGCHDPEVAGQKAADALFKKYSDVAAKCGAGMTLEVVPHSLRNGLKMSHGPAIKSTSLKGEKYVPWDLYRLKNVEGSTCTGPHEFCCEAPAGNPSNCPASARTSDCDAKGSCCCA